MKAIDDPEFFDYIEKFHQSIHELLLSGNEIRWDFGRHVFHNLCHLAVLGFQVSYAMEPTSILINGHYNSKELAVRFYNKIKIIDIASSERLPGTTKHYENNRTYFVRVFPAKDCLNASLYLEKLISKTMGHNVNLRYR